MTSLPRRVTIEHLGERGVAGLQSMEVFRSPQQANPSWVSVTELALIDPLLRT